MPVFISTVTTKGQTTVPEPVRAALALAPGKQLVWELDASQEGKPRLAVRLSPELDDLAGCLASGMPFPVIEEEKRAGQKERAKAAAVRERRALRR